MELMGESEFDWTDCELPNGAEGGEAQVECEKTRRATGDGMDGMWSQELLGRAGRNREIDHPVAVPAL